MKCKDRVKRKEKKKDFELETRAKKEHSTSVQLFYGTKREAEPRVIDRL